MRLRRLPAGARTAYFLPLALLALLVAGAYGAAEAAAMQAAPAAPAASGGVAICRAALSHGSSCRMMEPMTCLNAGALFSTTSQTIS